MRIPRVEIRPTPIGMGYYVQNHKGTWEAFAYVWAVTQFSTYWWQMLYLMADIDSVHPPRRKKRK